MNVLHLIPCSYKGCMIAQCRTHHVVPFFGGPMFGCALSLVKYMHNFMRYRIYVARVDLIEGYKICWMAPRMSPGCSESDLSKAVCGFLGSLVPFVQCLSHRYSRRLKDVREECLRLPKRRLELPVTSYFPSEHVRPCYRTLTM